VGARRCGGYTAIRAGNSTRNSGLAGVTGGLAPLRPSRHCERRVARSTAPLSTTPGSGPGGDGWTAGYWRLERCVRSPDALSKPGCDPGPGPRARLKRSGAWGGGGSMLTGHCKAPAPKDRATEGARLYSRADQCNRSAGAPQEDNGKTRRFLAWLVGSGRPAEGSYLQRERPMDHARPLWELGREHQWGCAPRDSPALAVGPMWASRSARNDAEARFAASDIHFAGLSGDSVAGTPPPSRLSRAAMENNPASQWGAFEPLLRRDRSTNTGHPAPARRCSG